MATLTSLFTDTANAIREKIGKTDTIVADNFPDEIRAITTNYPNGTEWTKSNLPEDWVSVIEYANGIWVATIMMDIYYSTDGKTWIKAELADGFNNFSYFTSISYNNGLWVATCLDEDEDLPYCLFYSPNGTYWVWNDEYQFYSVENINGVWVGVNDDGYYYSDDNCNSWTESPTAITPGMSLYKFDNIIIDIRFSTINYSFDGINWNSTTVTTDTSNQINDVYYADGVWLAVTRTGSFFNTDISNSNGWEPISIHHASFTTYYANGIYMFYYGDLYYSTDLINWSVNNTIDIRKIYNAAGIWIGAGYGPVYYSTDGKTWTATNLNLEDGRFLDIKHANGIWQLATMSGVYYSVTWE